MNRPTEKHCTHSVADANSDVIADADADAQSERVFKHNMVLRYRFIIREMQFHTLNLVIK